MTSKELVDWFDQNPDMRELMETCVKAVENDSGNLITVDDIEEHVFQELRKAGLIIVSQWAKKRETELSKELASKPEAKKHGKKKSHFIQSSV